MSTIIGIIIVIAILALLGKLYQMFKDRIQFTVNGLDSKFSFRETKLLWQVSKICHLQDPNSLYYSLPSLTKCMNEINTIINDKGPNALKMQELMTKLFNFRTKIQNEADEKKGLDSSMDLDNGQRLRIILPGKGVFVSEIVNNGSDITILMPKQNDMIPIPADEWVGKTVSVYLWRHGDARYVFDTVVNSQCIFLGKLCLRLRHSYNLLRTQKRHAVRAKCSIYADLYILNKPNINYSAVESAKGFRCLLEDISESGALIRIGGKGKQNMRIKLQFNINNKLVLMFGVVRTVEYNEEINQTRLHFECIHIDPAMKHEVLSYVYNMLPASDKEVYDAIKLTDSDSTEDSVENEVKKEVENGLNNINGVNIPKVEQDTGLSLENKIDLPFDLVKDVESAQDETFWNSLPELSEG